MSSSLETKFTGNAADLEKAYQAIQRENAKLREEQKKTAEDGKKHHEEELGLLGRAKEGATEYVQELGKMALGYLGVGKAVEGVNELLKQQAELQTKAAGVQQGLGATRASATRAMLGLDAEERSRVTRELEEIGLGAGVKEPQMMSIFAAARKTSGGDTAQAVEQVRQTLEIMPDAQQDPGEAARIAGDLGTVKRITGAGSIEEAMGRFAEMQLNGALLPRIEEMTKLGISPQQAIDLAKTASKAFPGDPTGGGDFALHFAREAQNFFDPGKIKERTEHELASPDERAARDMHDFLDRDDVRKQFNVRGVLPTGAKDLAEIFSPDRGVPGLQQAFVAERQRAQADVDRHDVAAMIKRLQEDKALQDDFMETATMRGDVAKIEARQLLTPGTTFGRSFEAEVAAPPATPGDAIARARETAASVQADPRTQQLKQKNVADVAEEQNEAADLEGGIEGTARQGLAKIRERRARRGAGSAFIAGMEDKVLNGIFGLPGAMDLGIVSPAEQYEGALREELRDLQFTTRFDADHNVTTQTPREMSADDRREVREIKQELEQWQRVKARSAAEEHAVQEEETLLDLGLREEETHHEPPAAPRRPREEARELVGRIPDEPQEAEPAGAIPDESNTAAGAMDAAVAGGASAVEEESRPGGRLFKEAKSGVETLNRHTEGVKLRSGKTVPYEMNDDDEVDPERYQKFLRDAASREREHAAELPRRGAAGQAHMANAEALDAKLDKFIALQEQILNETKNANREAGAAGRAAGARAVAASRVGVER